MSISITGHIIGPAPDKHRRNKGKGLLRKSLRSALRNLQRRQMVPFRTRWITGRLTISVISAAISAVWATGSMTKSCACPGPSVRSGENGLFLNKRRDRCQD